MKSKFCKPVIEALEPRALLSASVTPSASIAQPPSYALLGGNLNSPSDRVEDFPFVDLVKTTLGFYNLAGRQANNGQIDFAHTDSNGWPTEDFSFAAEDRSEFGDAMPAGNYAMSFYGPAGVTVAVRRNAPDPAAQVPAGAPVPTLHQLSYNASTYLYTFNVTVPQGVLVLAFDFHHTQGKVKNIKVLQAGYSLSSYPTFSTQYLNLLEDLSPGVIRLMDFTHTNGNPVANWADRTKTTSATQSRASAPGELQPLKGAAWEYGIQLANTLHANIWVNIPAHATDDYVTQLATLLRKTLDPSLSIYVEYSNEVWNSGQEQYSYNHQVASNEVVSMAKAGQTSTLNYDHLAVNTSVASGGANADIWADRRYARRSRQISILFQNAWTSAGLASPTNTRVRTILCSQFANASRFDNMLKFISAVYGPPSKYFYGIGVAPYLDLAADSSKNGLTTDQVIADLSADADRYLTNGAFAGIVSRAQKYGLKPVAYEGGVDTFGPNSIAAKQAASLDPRIQNIITGFLNTWYSDGGTLFNWYALGGRSYNSPYGTYSISDDITNLDEPKELAFKAIRDQALGG
ncbi:MAG TPA: LEPR-XLL domain-containing protein [Humisphaera sp.]|nr:LEPR-XLL domain-containing protein [Humisphaera sp.]